MKLVIKRIAASVVFLCILIRVIFAAGAFVRPYAADTDCLNYLYREDDDTINVVCFGSSAMYRFWIPQQAYEEKNMTSLLLATAQQEINATPYLMEEVLKTQDVDLFVVEIRRPLANEAHRLENKYDQKDETSKFAYLATSMKQSLNRFAMIDDLLVEDEENSKLEWMLPILKYHDNIHTFTADEIVARLNGIDEDAMYVRQFSGITSYERAVFEENEDYKLREEDKESIDRIAQKAEELGKKVLFLATPFVGKEVRRALHLQMSAYLEEQGYDYLDMNQYVDEIGLDFATDYYDSVHTNIAGARKVTAYLADYLSEHYELKDRLDEAQKQHWEKMCETWQQEQEKLMEKWNQNVEKGVKNAKG